jgi:hypothetical protein
LWAMHLIGRELPVFRSFVVKSVLSSAVPKSGRGLLYIHMKHVHILLFNGPSSVSRGRVL